jgi:hypothetical protein
MNANPPKESNSLPLTHAQVPAETAESETLQAHGLIEFRFILKFAAQLSTPCSRGLAIKPRAHQLRTRPAPRLFQGYLQRYSVLQ